MNTAIPSNAEITEIAALAERQLSLQSQLETAEKLVVGLSEMLYRVREVDLPAAMQQAGVSEIKLPTGEKIIVKRDVYASIPKDERYPQALAWLREHDLGDVIKTEVAVSFGRGEEEQAVALVAELKLNGWNNFTNTQGVHSSTLKALIREQLAKGADFPMEMFGAYPTAKAVIK